jgi:hypothetical protein
MGTTLCNSSQNAAHPGHKSCTLTVPAIQHHTKSVHNDRMQSRSQNAAAKRTVSAKTFLAKSLRHINSSSAQKPVWSALKLAMEDIVMPCLVCIMQFTLKVCIAGHVVYKVKACGATSLHERSRSSLLQVWYWQAGQTRTRTCSTHRSTYLDFKYLWHLVPSGV